MKYQSGRLFNALREFYPFISLSFANILVANPCFARKFHDTEISEFRSFASALSVVFGRGGGSG